MRFTKTFKSRNYEEKWCGCSDVKYIHPHIPQCHQYFILIGYIKYVQLKSNLYSQTWNLLNKQNQQQILVFCTFCFKQIWRNIYNTPNIYHTYTYIHIYIHIYHPMYYAFKSNLSWHVEENVRLAKIKAPESTYLFLNDFPPTFSFGIANQCLQKNMLSL